MINMEAPEAVSEMLTQFLDRFCVSPS